MPAEEWAVNADYREEHPVLAPLPQPVNCIANGSTNVEVDVGLRRLFQLPSRTKASPASFSTGRLSENISPAVGILASGKIRCKGPGTEEQALLAVQIKLNTYRLSGIPIYLEQVSVSNQVYAVPLGVPLKLFFLKYIAKDLHTYNTKKFPGASLTVYYDWQNDRLVDRLEEGCACYKLVIHRIGKISIPVGMSFPSVVMFRMWQRVYDDIFTRMVDVDNLQISSKVYSVEGKREMEARDDVLQHHKKRRRLDRPSMVEDARDIFF